MTDALVEAVRIAITPHFSSAQRAYGDDRDAARAALEAVEASEAHVVVPWKPTAAMEAAGVDAAGHAHPDSAVTVIYCAMISARPKQED